MDAGARMSDGEAVRRVLAGEVECLRVLVQRYTQEFGRLAEALVGDADAAEDALQEAFISAYERLGSCRDPDRFGGWFYRIVANKCLDAKRRKKLLPLDDDVAARETADGPMREAEVDQLFQGALAELTPEQREAFVMREVDGRSYEEMAVLMDTGVDALKMRVHRARDALKKRLGKVL